jgi:hypothetical protein
VRVAHPPPLNPAPSPATMPPSGIVAPAAPAAASISRPYASRFGLAQG